MSNGKTQPNESHIGRRTFCFVAFVVVVICFVCLFVCLFVCFVVVELLRLYQASSNKKEEEIVNFPSFAIAGR